MVTHSHFSPYPTLPKCRHLPSSSYPGWNKLGPVCAHTLPGGMQRILEIWGSAEPGAVPELWRSRVHRHHHERQSLIARSKQEAGGRIAANAIPRWECFLTRSTCSHPAGKVWASSEGGQRENLISPCSAASANCRRGGRVELVDGSERAWAAQRKGSCWPCPRSPGVPHMPGKIHLGTAVIVCSPGCLSLKTLAVLSRALPRNGNAPAKSILCQDAKDIWKSTSHWIRGLWGLDLSPENLFGAVYILLSNYLFSTKKIISFHHFCWVGGSHEWLTMEGRSWWNNKNPCF